MDAMALLKLRAAATAGGEPDLLRADRRPACAQELGEFTPAALAGAGTEKLSWKVPSGLTGTAIPSMVVGDPETCRRKLEAFADLGVDRLMCLVQFGELSQSSVLRSLHAIGEHLLPHYRD